MIALAVHASPEITEPAEYEMTTCSLLAWFASLSGRTVEASRPLPKLAGSPPQPSRLRQPLFGSHPPSLLAMVLAHLRWILMHGPSHYCCRVLPVVSRSNWLLLWSAGKCSPLKMLLPPRLVAECQLQRWSQLIWGNALEPACLACTGQITAHSRKVCANHFTKSTAVYTSAARPYFKKS